MDEETKRHIAKKIISSPRLVHKFIQMYNSLCPECREKCIKDSSRPMEEYCEKCQEKVKPILENVYRGLK
jgi:hypothetical protein